MLKKISKRLLLSSKLLNNIYLKKFQEIAFTGKDSNLCLSYNFLPLPVHFYSPVPDIFDLIKRNVWKDKSQMVGINFNIDSQLKLLRNLGKSYENECQWPINRSEGTNSSSYYANNGSFSYGCAATLYSIIRKFKPVKIVEIGSGESSKIIKQALLKNKSQTDYIIIDPFPQKYIKKDIIPSRLFKKKVELMPLKIFKSLMKNDILFIDSSHIVKTGNDVNYLYLTVLPQLSKGVLIHIHDITLPYEYPKEYFISETFRQFWTEQYLLQAFLSFNNSFEILLTLYPIMKDFIEKYKKAYVFYDSNKHKLLSSSFWIRRK